MGQKIHPIGFRVGITKEHNVKWFANFRTFPKILKEDQQIRQAWDKVAKKYSSLTFNAQITKICIQRQKTFLQLRFYAGRPYFLIENNGKVFKNFRNKLKMLSSENYRFQVIKDPKGSVAAITVAKTIVISLEKRMAYKRVLKQISLRLREESTPGFKIQISGRLNGVSIARKYWIRKGRVPSQTLDAGIDYSLQEAHTKYGVVGIKVTIFRPG